MTYYNSRFCLSDTSLLTMELQMFTEHKNHVLFIFERGDCEQKTMNLLASVEQLENPSKMY